MEQDYSVLMSVYKGEKPEYLNSAINSMINQTIPTNDFVLVCDTFCADGVCQREGHQRADYAVGE